MGEAIRAGARVWPGPQVVLVFALGGGSVLGFLAGSRPPVNAAEDRKAERLTERLVYLDHPDGQRLLKESGYRESFVPLGMHFISQDNLAYCGVATSAMVLNATGIERPVSPEHAPYKLFTQRNLFNDEVRKVAPPERVRMAGMTLETLGKVLGSFPVKVKVIHAGEDSLDNFKKAALQCLKGTDSFLVVNYLRKAIGQQSVGHISPIRAYHKGEDRFLILDVSRYKYPPVWVKADELWKAMEAIDTESRKSRGYIIVMKASKP
jgi:Phytochelatin synthase